MCGLVGFVGWGDKHILHNMCNQLIHRGPDDQGMYIDDVKQVFLGHRRLAIIDITGGQQPMWDCHETIGVIFNGEIYNHAELRKKLIDLGHIFCTDHSDTEVLIHGYKQWGEKLPEFLNGMFAFAIYDKRNNLIYIARDPLGEKPLYFSHSDKLFIFASEVKAFFPHPHYTRRLNRDALKKYFAYGFLPAPHCQYLDTFKLPAGNWLKFDIITKRITQHVYWKFSIEPDDRYTFRNENDIGDELVYLLDNSVKRRLQSDVPLGVFLSGGIDSSAILAIASRHLPSEQINTFSVGFTEKSYDESRYANFVAKHFKSKHFQTTLDVEKTNAILPIIFSQLDEPLSDASLLSTYLLCSLARKKVTVALGGDGSDELFAGYDPFQALKMASIYHKITPKWLHSYFLKMADLLPASIKNMSLNFKLRQALRGLSYAPPIWNSVWLSPLTPDEIEELFQEPISIEDLYSEMFAIWENCSSDLAGNKTLEFYTSIYLQDNILMKLDRASMMTSLECRSPFLDIELVNFAKGLPFHLKYRNGVRKYILKKALTNILPAVILKRRKKGFGVPIGAWLQTQSDDTLLSPNENCNQNFVVKRWDEHRSKKVDHRLFLWAWLIAQKINVA